MLKKFIQSIVPISLVACAETKYREIDRDVDPDGWLEQWFQKTRDVSMARYRLRKKGAGKIRIACAGDSITQGECATEITELAELQEREGYQMDGSKFGQLGYPYKLWKLLQN